MNKEDFEMSVDATMVVDRARLGLDSETEEAVAVLTILSGSRRGVTYELRDECTVIGRGDASQIRLDDDGVSRAHASVIKLTPSTFQVEDRGSTNGTFVNGHKVSKQALKDGDRIALGGSTIAKFEYHDVLEARLKAELYQRATRDVLTGLGNRRLFFERLHEEFSYAQRHGAPLSLVMFDVDHFKRVNDTYGHGVGDQMLILIGKTLLDLCRNEDVCCRYGGEEFAIIARGLDKPQGVAMAQRVRVAIEAASVEIDAGTLSCTISAGVATFEGMGTDKPEELLAEADAFLYRAKEAGRNRVEAEGMSS